MLDHSRIEDRLRNAQFVFDHPELQDFSNHAQQYIDYASTHGYMDVLARLKDAGIENTARLTEMEHALHMYSEPVLRAFCENGNADELIKAIASGTGVNTGDVDGDTPLMLAAAHGQTEAVRILLAVGANPNHSNHYGETALSLARQFNRPSVIALLS